jgi:hypothetical protein
VLKIAELYAGRMKIDVEPGVAHARVTAISDAMEIHYTYTYVGEIYVSSGK